MRKIIFNCDEISLCFWWGWNIQKIYSKARRRRERNFISACNVCYNWINSWYVPIATLRAMPLIMKYLGAEFSDTVKRRKIVKVSRHKWENGQRGKSVIKFQLRTFCAINRDWKTFFLAHIRWCVGSEKAQFATKALN